MVISIALSSNHRYCTWCDEPYDGYVISEYASAAIDGKNATICSGCCSKKLAEVGLSNVAIRFTTGPFCHVE